MKLLLLVLLLSEAIASALTFEWDASPDATVTGYRLYAGTNSGVTNALVKLDVRKNLTCTVEDLKPGRWFFVATAYATSTNGTNIATLESLPSNELVVSIPPTPPNLRTVVVQWNGTVVSTNWQDAGFFRIKLIP